METVSWFRKFDSDISAGFYAFDVGVISSIHNKILQVHFEEGGERYDVFFNPTLGPTVLYCLQQGKISGDC
jgi:hypothetical protein